MTFDPYPHVAVSQKRAIFGSNALLFFANKGPDLVAFDVADLYVSDLLGHDAFAFLASENQELQDRRVMDFGSAFNARNTIAFEQ
jgi:hypothetical protein